MIRYTKPIVGDEERAGLPSLAAPSDVHAEPDVQTSRTFDPHPCSCCTLRDTIVVTAPICARLPQQLRIPPRLPTVRFTPPLFLSSFGSFGSPTARRENVAIVPRSGRKLQQLSSTPDAPELLRRRALRLCGPHREPGNPRGDGSLRWGRGGGGGWNQRSCSCCWRGSGKRGLFRGCRSGSRWCDTRARAARSGCP